MSAEPEAGSPSPGAADDASPAVAVLVAWAVRALPLVVVLFVVAAVIPGVPWWSGVLLGLIAAAAWVWLLWQRAGSWLLAALGATPASEGDHTRFLNLVQGLSLTSASREPAVYVIDSPARNGAAVSHGDTVAVVATTGLLRALDRIGLEAMVAELVVRLGNGDARASTRAAALFGPLRQGPLGAVLTPVADFGQSRLLGGERELQADRAAVALTRFPPGLLGALDVVRAGPVRLEDVPPSLDHVWVVPPPSVGEPSTPTTATPLDLRIDVLAEL